MRLERERGSQAEKIRAEREAALKRGEELNKQSEQAFFAKQSKYLADKDKMLADRRAQQEREVRFVFVDIVFSRCVLNDNDVYCMHVFVYVCVYRNNNKKSS